MVRRKKLQESCREKKKFKEKKIQVSQVTSSPRRGPTFNNRWWNDQRSWNLRTTNSREKASPKGANHIQSCSCSPPSGTIREFLSLSAGSIPFGHSTRGYSHSPPSGTVECYLRNFRKKEVSLIPNRSKPHSESK